MPLEQTDRDAIKSMIDDALAGAGEQFAAQARTAATEAMGEIAGQIKTLGEQVTTLAAGKGDGKAKGEQAGDDQPVTLKVLTDALAERDAKAAEEGKKAKAGAAAQAYAAQHMKDLPAAYRNLLPATEDAAELKRAEQTIRAQAVADAKAAGWKVPDVGDATGSTAGNPVGQGGVDASKLSATQKITEGLRQMQAAQ